MDPRKLLYLVSVIEHGSFKRAAKHLSVSQPALSTSMDRLEGSVGGKLLERGPGGVTPTALGQLIYSHARLIRDEIGLAGRRMQRGDPVASDPITLGTLPSLASNVVPAALRKWRRRHETGLLRVLTLNQLELTLNLIRGDVDFIVGMTDFFGHIEGLRQRVLFRDRLYVIARPDHPALRMPNLSWEKLTRFPWITQMFGRDRSMLETLLKTDGTGPPEQLTECGSVDFIRSLVAETDSLAFFPGHAVAADVHVGRLRPLNLGAAELGRDIAVVFRESFHLREAALELVSEIKAAGLTLSQDDLLGAIGG